MRTKHRILSILILSLLLPCSLVHAQIPPGPSYSTGLYATDQIDFIIRSDRSETLYYQTPTGVVNQNLLPYADYTQWHTASISMPSNPYLGFRSTSGEPRLNPIYWDDTTPPALSNFTPLETDPSGDHLYNSAWLDITSTSVCFSSSRLYFAINNNHTSFPVSSGLTFYAYMPVMIDPDADPGSNPIVFGLMYTVEVAGTIGPGLYKITGTGFGGLNQIGELEHSVVDNTLILSCALSDLLADPDFSAWYDPANPRLATITTTSRITLTGGIQQSDSTSGTELLLLPQLLDSANLNEPMLSNAAYVPSPIPEILASASILYTDPDHNFPRIASISIDGSEEYPLQPVNLDDQDFSGSVLFQRNSVPVPGNWSQIRFRFSHGDGFIYQYLANGSPIQDETLPPVPQLQLYPNPAVNSIQLKTLAAGHKGVSVFNIRGQLVMRVSLDPTKDTADIDISSLPAGVYILSSNSHPAIRKRFCKIDR